MRKILSLIVILGCVSITLAQQTIVGYAPAYIGQKVKLYTYKDYLTMNRVQIGEGIVAKSDSTFRITYSTKSTIKGVIEIEETEADLYLAPGKDYSVYFPREDEVESNTNSETELYFLGLDTLDINYLVLQYHRWFDAYIAYHQEEVMQGRFLGILDSFKVYAAAAYADIDNPYFITYVRYDLAELEQTRGGNRRSEKRLETYLDYIDPFPVYFENDRYMKFIRAFYDKEFREYLPSTEKMIWEAISKSSPTLLMQALKSDIFLAKPELRELVMIDKLGKAFYRESNFRPNIVAILDSVATHATSPSNASVAKNVKDYITKLEPGYPAPTLALKGKGDDLISWSTYNGKFVYFNFFATWNDKAIADMEIISKLAVKYDEDIAFVSICIDSDSATYKAFMTAHPTYNWDVFYVGEDHELARSFNVTAVPIYFLIDQDGFIFSAPALSPSPNGEYESIEKIFREINKALHPVETQRVGEK